MSHALRAKERRRHTPSIRPHALVLRTDALVLRPLARCVYQTHLQATSTRSCTRASGFTSKSLCACSGTMKRRTKHAALPAPAAKREVNRLRYSTTRLEYSATCSQVWYCPPLPQTCRVFFICVICCRVTLLAHFVSPAIRARGAVHLVQLIAKYKE
jgi:hypothetical protein